MTINEGAAPMTDASKPTRYDFEYSNGAGDPDEKGTLSQDQAVLADEVTADPHAPAFDFHVVNDEKLGIYDGIVGDREVAGLTYKVAGNDRLVLLATSVFPDFRNQGIATELIRRVLDDVRGQGKTITITCPIVRNFIEHHPEYADLVDPEHPGVTPGHSHLARSHIGNVDAVDAFNLTGRTKVKTVIRVRP